MYSTFMVYKIYFQFLCTCHVFFRYIKKSPNNFGMLKTILFAVNSSTDIPPQTEVNLLYDFEISDTPDTFLEPWHIH